MELGCWCRLDIKFRLGFVGLYGFKLGLGLSLCLRLRFLGCFEFGFKFRMRFFSEFMFTFLGF